MSITLSVQRFRDAALEQQLARRFERPGGTLGRAPGNHLVLDDPGKSVSRQQARLEHRGDGWHLVDLGSNPSVVNGQAVGAGRSVRLADGDRLAIGDYVLAVGVQEAPLPVTLGADDSLVDASILQVGPPPAAPAVPAVPSVPAWRGTDSDHVPPEQAAFVSAPAIPADYDPLADFRPPPPAAPAAAPAAAQGDAVLRALLRGLGLPGLHTGRSAEEVAELAGAMLREATAGAMGALLARALTKRESRLEMTLISVQANNPLKFFPDAAGALAQMLDGTMPGYMAPQRAYADAFDDLKAHELAMVAGMRAALDGVLRRFDPAAIEAQMDEPGVMDKLVAASRKARMWDRLVALYRQLAVEAADDCQRLYGAAFSAAYEEQTARLARAAQGGKDLHGLEQ